MPDRARTSEAYEETANAHMLTACRLGEKALDAPNVRAQDFLLARAAVEAQLAVAAATLAVAVRGQ